MAADKKKYLLCGGQKHSREESGNSTLSPCVVSVNEGYPSEGVLNSGNDAR